MSKLSGTETSTSYLATDGWTFGRKNKLRIFTILTFCTLPPAVFSKIQFKERITHLMSSDYMWISIFQTSSYFWSQGGLVSAGYQTDIMQILAGVSPVIVGPDIIESRGNQDKPMQSVGQLGGRYQGKPTSKAGSHLR